MRKQALWAVLPLVLLVIAGCGNGKSDNAAGEDSLMITFVKDTGAAPATVVLDCPSTATGKQAVCDAITAKLLAPTPADQACTMIYGGPETATITGTLRGDAVDAKFSRTDGCEIARWSAMSKALEPLGIAGLTV